VEERVTDGVRWVVTRVAPERLIPDSIPPADRARLLWFEGRAAQPTRFGSVVVDTLGQILSFTHRLEPGRPPVRIGTRIPVSAALDRRQRLWVTVADGAVLALHPDGVPALDVRTPFPHPALAVDPSGEGVWAVRSTYRFEFLLDSVPAPSVIRLDAAGRVIRRVGAPRLPAHVLLTELANAGHVVSDRERIYFAPFIRDEIVAFGMDGRVRWVGSRALPQNTDEPRFELEEGRPVIAYHPVNLGITLGPDQRLYVLSTPRFTTSASRLDVFDPATGRLLRTTELPTPVPTLAADTAGRVYLLDPRRLLSGSAPATRPLAPEVDLPLLDGGPLSLRDLRGRVVLINVWASWCLPCREEMPALDSLQRRLAGAEFAFLAINEDVDVADARKFLDELGLDLTVPVGRGRMKGRFHYPGLPFTVLLDRAGRVARTWIGFAGPAQIRLIETVARAELGEVRPGAEADSGRSPVHRH
jgi:thiol-disulfide isomerase/thioredoxin